MPPASHLPPAHDLPATWAFLQEGIDVMMTRLTEGMLPQRYMELYTVVYNYCASSRMHLPSGGVDLGGAGAARLGANLVGAELYNHLIKYFQAHCKEVRKGSESLSDEALLKYYAAEWDRYTSGANYVHRLFSYLNRYWVKHGKEEGRKNVYTVYTLALVQWKEKMFKAVQAKGKLVQALLKQVEKQRSGEVMETSLVKKVVDSFVLLGLDETDSTKENLSVYRTEFEKPFLAATEAFYQSESEAFVGANSVTDYMRKAENRLREEEGRVDMYLHASTRAKLITTCENVLVRAHAPLLWDEFQALLDANKGDDLYRMYTLLYRIPEGLEPLREKFEGHVKKMGQAAVEKIAGTADAADSLDPAAYVNALLEVHRVNLATVTASFRNESGFLASLDKACRDFMNRNKATGTSTSKSPELLAKHTDGLLKKSNKNTEEAGLDEALQDVMIVFKYIEDKDVFQKFYSKMLARRLVNFSSASDDAEASMITRLKEACGFEYTNKLQRMFTDMGLSKELNDAFNQSRAHESKSDGAIDFYALVLANGFWPLTAPTSEFSIPTELQAAYQRFERYYGAKHSGRKLTWLWQLGKNELKTNYLGQKLIFQTSTYQAGVLLQFNTSDSLSYADLQQAVKLNDAALKPVLNLLVKAKVLLQSGDSYSINADFKSKKMRVNLNLPVKSEQKAESKEVMQNVSEDRKMLLQAVIVRLMKARKSMRHNDLVTETIGQVSNRFTPAVVDIKKAIEGLIDKEYLERAEGTKDMLNYLA